MLNFLTRKISRTEVTLKQASDSLAQTPRGEQQPVTSTRCWRYILLVYEPISWVKSKRKLAEIFKASRIGERLQRQMSWGCARAGDWAERGGGRGARKEGGGAGRETWEGWGRCGVMSKEGGGSEGCGRGASLWSCICHVSFFDAQTLTTRVPCLTQPIVQLWLCGVLYSASLLSLLHQDLLLTLSFACSCATLDSSLVSPCLFRLFSQLYQLLYHFLFL